MKEDIMKARHWVCLGAIFVLSLSAFNSFSLDFDITTKGTTNELNDQPQNANLQNNDYTIYEKLFSSFNPLGTGSKQWQEIVGASYIAYVGNSYIEFNSDAFGSVVNCTLEFNYNLLDFISLGYNYKEARIMVDWRFDLAGASSTNAVIQYSRNGGNWQNMFTPSTGGFTRENTTYPLLQQCSVQGSDTSLRIRFQINLRRAIGENPYVYVYGVYIGTLKATIKDNSTISPLNTIAKSVNINASVLRSGTESGLSVTYSDYRIGVSSVSGDAARTTPQLYLNPYGSTVNGDNITLNYLFTPTAIGTYYYSLHITAAGGYIYTTPALSFTYYDGISPTIDSHNPTANLNYGQSFQVTGTVADTGGAGLQRMEFYWSFSNTVSNTSYLGNSTKVFSGTVNSGTYNFSVPSDFSVYGQAIHYRFYLYDKSNNYVVSTNYSIVPGDSTVPQVNPIGTTATSIGYENDKTLQFQAIEPQNSSGLNYGSASFKYKVGVNDFALAEALTHTAFADNVWTYQILAGNFSGQQTVYTWFIISDNAGNQRIYNLNFGITDGIPPTLDLNTDNPAMNMSTAKTGQYVLIAVRASDGARGSGIQSVKLAIRGGASVNWDLSTQFYDGVLQSGDEYYIIIPADVFQFPNTYYYKIRAVDQSNLITEISGDFVVTAGATSSSSSSEQTSGSATGTGTNTDSQTNSGSQTTAPGGNDQSNTWIYIVFSAIAIGGAAVGIVIMKKKKMPAVPSQFETKSDSKGSYSSARMTVSEKPNTVSSSPVAAESDTGWEDIAPTTPKSGGSSRSGVFSSAVLPPSAPTTEPSNLPSTSATIGATITSSPNAASTTEVFFDPMRRMDDEMKELYNNAKEFLELGQTGMAQKSFEMLVRLAEKTHDTQLLEFLKKEMTEIY
jgi:hypothetical protein